MPVWSEIVNLSWPIGFHPDYEVTHGGHYMTEMVPKGETAHQWSQMVTVTGEKGLSANPNLDAIKFSFTMVSGFTGNRPHENQRPRCLYCMGKLRDRGT
jgi:hypothetical protein